MCVCVTACVLLLHSVPRKLKRHLEHAQYWARVHFFLWSYNLEIPWAHYLCFPICSSNSPSSALECLHLDAFIRILSLWFLHWDGFIRMLSFGCLLQDAFLWMPFLRSLLLDAFFGTHLLGCFLWDAIFRMSSSVWLLRDTFSVEFLV